MMVLKEGEQDFGIAQEVSLLLILLAKVGHILVQRALLNHKGMNLVTGRRDIW